MTYLKNIIPILLSLDSRKFLYMELVAHEAAKSIRGKVYSDKYHHDF